MSAATDVQAVVEEAKRMLNAVGKTALVVDISEVEKLPMVGRCQMPKGWELALLIARGRKHPQIRIYEVEQGFLLVRGELGVSQIEELFDAGHLATALARPEDFHILVAEFPTRQPSEFSKAVQNFSHGMLIRVAHTEDPT